MADVNAFRTALNRCGSTIEGSNLIIEAGFLSTEDFAILTAKRLNEMIDRFRRDQRRIYENELRTDPDAEEPTVVINDMAQIKINGFLLWCKKRVHHGQPPTANLFSDATIDDFAKLYSDEKSEAKSDLVKKPRKLTSNTDFPVFSDELDNYLDNLISANGVSPSSYVIRTDTLPMTQIDPGYTFANDFERLVLCTPHSGSDYLKDNQRVFAILREATLNESSESHLLPFLRSRDGRSAWLALKLSAEGGVNSDIALDTAIENIEKLKYRGELANFGIKDLNSRIVKYFAILEKHGDGLTDREMIRRYKKCFKENQDSTVRAAIATIGSNDRYANDFTATKDFMHTQCLSVNWPSSAMKRQIGSVTSGTLSDGSTKPQLKWYSADEYKKLTKAQREYLYTNKSKRDDSTVRNKSNKKLRRQLKSVKKKLDEATDGKKSNDKTKEDTPSAGQQFQDS